MRAILRVSLVALTFALIACEQQSQKALNEYVSEAASYLHGGDMRSALIVLKNGVQAYPEDAGLRLLLAATHIRNNDGDSAEIQAHKAAQLGAREADAKFAEVEALILQEAYSKAAETLADDFGSLPPHESLRHLELSAETNFHLGKLELAKKQLSELGGKTVLHARPLVLKARIALLAGDSDEAKSMLQQATGTDPANYAAWVALGNLEADAHRWVEAISYYSKAVDLGVIATKALWGRAFASIQIKDFDAALRDAASLRKGRAETPASAFITGLVMLSQEKYEDALALLQVANKPEFKLPVLHLLLGIAHFRLGELYLADQSIRSYLFDQGPDVEAELLLAQVRLANGDGPGAVEVLDGILRRDPGNLQATQMKATQSIRQGDLVTASALVAGVTQTGEGSADLLLSRGILSLVSGDEATGIEILEQVERKGVVDVRGLTLLVLKEIDEKKFESARSRIEQIEKLVPERALAYSLYGAYYLAQEQFQAAGAAFEAALKAEPGHVPSIRGLSSLALLEKDVEKAEQIYRSGLSIKPQVVSLNIGYAQLALQSGNEADYESRLRDSVKRVPREPRLVTALIRHLLKGKRFDEATVVANTAKRHNLSANAEFVEVIGDLSLAKGESAQAVDWYKKLTELYPGVPGAWYKLAVVQQRMNDSSGAKSSLRAGLENSPGNLNLLASLATLEVAEKNFSNAEKLLDEIRAVDDRGFVTNNIGVRVAMAKNDYAEAARIFGELYSILPNEQHAIGIVDSLRRSNNLDKASSEGVRLLGLHSDSTKLRILLAGLQKEMGDANRAIQLYKEVLASDSNNAVALNNLAVLLTAIDPVEATKVARMVYDKHSDKPAIADTYAWALFRNGDVNAAADVYSRFDDPQLTPSMKYHFAVVLASLGRNAHARQLLSGLQGLTFDEAELASELNAKLSM